MIILSLRVFDCLLRIWGRILQHYPFILTNFFRLETFSDSESFGGGILNLEVGERWRCFLQPLTILTLTPIETSDPPGMTRLKKGGNLTPQNDIQRIPRGTSIQKHNGRTMALVESKSSLKGIRVPILVVGRCALNLQGNVCNGVNGTLMERQKVVWEKPWPFRFVHLDRLDNKLNMSGYT